MTCDRHQAVEDLVSIITDALSARGRAVKHYRGDLSRELVREAALLATRLLGRPTRTVDRPDGLYVTMPGWTGEQAHADLDGARIRQTLGAASDAPHSTDRTRL